MPISKEKQLEALLLSKKLCGLCGSGLHKVSKVEYIHPSAKHLIGGKLNVCGKCFWTCNHTLKRCG